MKFRLERPFITSHLTMNWLHCACHLHDVSVTWHNDTL